MFNSLNSFATVKGGKTKSNKHKELKKDSYVCMRVIKVQKNSIYKPLLKYANILQIKGGHELELMQRLKILKVID